jgi:hypothetical protein
VSLKYLNVPLPLAMLSCSARKTGFARITDVKLRKADFSGSSVSPLLEAFARVAAAA